MNMVVPTGFPKGTSHWAMEGGIALLRGAFERLFLGGLITFPAEESK